MLVSGAFTGVAYSSRITSHQAMMGIFFYNYIPSMGRRGAGGEGGERQNMSSKLESLVKV